MRIPFHCIITWIPARRSREARMARARGRYAMQDDSNPWNAESTKLARRLAERWIIVRATGKCQRKLTSQRLEHRIELLARQMSYLEVVIVPASLLQICVTVSDPLGLAQPSDITDSRLAGLSLWGANDTRRSVQPQAKSTLGLFQPLSFDECPHKAEGPAESTGRRPVWFGGRLYRKLTTPMHEFIVPLLVNGRVDLCCTPAASACSDLLFQLLGLSGCGQCIHGLEMSTYGSVFSMRAGIPGPAESIFVIIHCGVVAWPIWWLHHIGHAIADIGPSQAVWSLGNRILFVTWTDNRMHLGLSFCISPLVSMKVTKYLDTTFLKYWSEFCWMGHPRLSELYWVKPCRGES